VLEREALSAQFMMRPTGTQRTDGFQLGAASDEEFYCGALPKLADAGMSGIGGGQSVSCPSCIPRSTDRLMPTRLGVLAPASEEASDWPKVALGAPELGRSLRTVGGKPWPTLSMRL
jgi:hypothetical protein